MPERFPVRVEPDRGPECYIPLRPDPVRLRRNLILILEAWVRLDARRRRSDDA